MKTTLIKLLAVAICSLPLFGQAQTDMSKWSIGLFPSILQYTNSDGSEVFKLKQSSFAGDLGVGYQINPSFMVEGHFMGGHLDFDNGDPETENLDADVFDLTAQLLYKFNNGYILKEDATLSPFLFAGVGGILSEAGNGAVIPLGAGLNVRFDDLFSLQWRSAYKLATPDTYNFMQHSLGFVWHLDGASEPKEKEEAPQDRDNDGVVDALDKCPDTPGFEANNGCPDLDDETREVLTAALEGIQFETGKDVLKNESYPILDRVVALLKKHPEYNLSIEGHTDSSGDDAMNLDLSKRRAKRAKDYIVSKGISENRLISEGFGETRPVADNSTSEGRAQNRRVEFKVSF